MFAARPPGFPALADVVSGSGSSSTLVIVGLVVVVALLLGALVNNARAMAGVAATAMGCLARTVGTIVFGSVLLVLLVVAMANGSTGSSSDAPESTAPTTTSPSVPHQPAGPRAGG